MQNRNLILEVSYFLCKAYLVAVVVKKIRGFYSFYKMVKVTSKLLLYLQKCAVCFSPNDHRV